MVQYAAYGILWGLIGTLALTQMAEVAFGFPHHPGIAYAVSGGFAVWTAFALRAFSKLERPAKPTWPAWPFSDDDGGDRPPGPIRPVLDPVRQRELEPV